MSRRISREKALQALFQIDLVNAKVERAVDYVLEQSVLEQTDAQFTRQLVTGTVEHLKECDEYIVRYAVQWGVDRLANVDRSILRMAIYEMKYVEEVPHTVTINEAIELAKAFSNEDSAKFINGLLDAIRKNELVIT
ncbi:transcription antitermination factor NusB [Metallumcola ferriviriculae]|uniref:Transcription antitermination protein NusB n=1 Tax=Metallumcola ferriviriculae TaxID=3039180 RepID=A0AAU0UQN5_9FIRM|nr:transcription antitermination factor NusB [Desulfitibacteraceae bacterium MK1]